MEQWRINNLLWAGHLKVTFSPLYLPGPKSLSNIHSPFPAHHRIIKQSRWSSKHINIYVIFWHQITLLIYFFQKHPTFPIMILPMIICVYDVRLFWWHDLSTRATILPIFNWICLSHVSLQTISSIWMTIRNIKHISVYKLESVVHEYTHVSLKKYAHARHQIPLVSSLRNFTVTPIC